MSQHEPISSEGGAAGGEAARAERPSATNGERAALGPHESVAGGDVAGETTAPEVASFEGMAGSLESVEGFQPTQAVRELALSEEVDVTEALAGLRPVEAIEFEEQETVCGSDERVHISPATAIPWRWCCQLLITLGNGAGARGTGWFIGPRTVMTAGHCVFSHSAGGWARSIEVIPGMDAASRPYGSQLGTSFRSVTGWTTDANVEYDYGAIILPNGNLGNTVGWFGFAALGDSELQNLFVNTSGYPGDKPFGTQWFNGGNITQVAARRLFYMHDTFGGQSGSCVWRFQSGLRHAVGIHAYGGCPNKAVRIVTQVYNNMLAWRNL